MTDVDEKANNEIDVIGKKLNKSSGPSLRPAPPPTCSIIEM